MPDINDRICKRRTATRIDNRYIQQQENARASLGDVGSEQLSFNVVWADLLFGAQLA
jgi:hypothetical protein